MCLPRPARQCSANKFLDSAESPAPVLSVRFWLFFSQLKIIAQLRARTHNSRDHKSNQCVGLTQDLTLYCQQSIRVTTEVPVSECIIVFLAKYWNEPVNEKPIYTHPVQPFCLTMFVRTYNCLVVE